MWRVSSQAIRSADSKAARARGERSSRLPIGVATTSRQSSRALAAPGPSVARDLLVQVDGAAREPGDQHQPALEAERCSRLTIRRTTRSS